MAEKPVIAALLEYRATEHPEQTFVKWRDERISWGAFYDGVLRIASGLRALGVEQGDRVAVMMPNRPEFLLAHFGAICAGAAPVPVNTAQRGDTLSYLLKDCGARAIVIDDSLRAQYAETGAGLLEIVRGDAKDATTFEKLLSTPPVEIETEGGTSFGVLYTSGTTGPPKGVVPMRTDITPLLAMWDAMNVRAFDAVEFNHVGAVIPILLKQPEQPSDRDNPMRTVLSAGCPPHCWEPFQERFGVRIVEQFSMV
ncbi:MAG: acyl--CoA ligase, partial [Actinobacteria bacterium]